MVFLPWAPIKDLDRDRTVLEMAQRYNTTPRQIVIDWLLARSPSLLPTPVLDGAASRGQRGSCVIKLTPADVASLSGGTR
jgi:pyridoxine 4-dehydrogenase